MENNEFNDIDSFVDALIFNIDTYQMPVTMYGYINCIQSILGVLLNNYNLDVASINLDYMTDDIYGLVIDSDYMVYVYPVDKCQDEYNEQYDYGFLYIDQELPTHFVNYIDKCGYDYCLVSIEYCDDLDCLLDSYGYGDNDHIVRATFDIGIPGIYLMYDPLSNNSWKFFVDEAGDD